MRVFMRDTNLNHIFDIGYGKDWVQVYENDWDEDDVYIDDSAHGSRCWGDCYDKSDLKYIIERRKKNEGN